MKRAIAIFCLFLCGISAHAQTLAGTMGAIGVASALQGIGSNAAAIGLNAAQNAVNTLNGQTTGAAATANATPRPATPAPAAPARPAPATPAPARPTAPAPAPAPGGGAATGAGGGGTTGGAAATTGGGGTTTTTTGGGGYGGRYMNNGYGQGVRGSSAGPTIAGRTITTPRRPVVVISTSLRTARLNLRLGFNSYTQTPASGGGATP